MKTREKNTDQNATFKVMHFKTERSSRVCCPSGRAAARADGSLLYVSAWVYTVECNPGLTVAEALERKKIQTPHCYSWPW